MHLKLLSPEHLFFDPLKPVILRGSRNEDGRAVLSGNVVLQLSKSTKIMGIVVQFQSTAVTYWPEGVGMRGTTFHIERNLDDQKFALLKRDDGKAITLEAGTHRFPFMFLIDNSLAQTINNVYGRVQHVIHAKVVRAGLQQLLQWEASQEVLVLRAYMSNSRLFNNSMQDLTAVYHKSVIAADVQFEIEFAAFSAGDPFHMRMVIQPRLKEVRITGLEITVVERRHYHDPLYYKADRFGHTVFPLKLTSSAEVADGCDSTRLLKGLMNGERKEGIELYGEFAHRLMLATPTCQDQINHTTNFQFINFSHRAIITLKLAYPNDEYSADIPSDVEISPTSTPPGTPDINEHTSPSSAWRLFKRPKKPKARQISPFKEEIVQYEVPVMVFDCRLKEDFGRLPSYDELGVSIQSTDRLSQKASGSCTVNNSSSTSTSSSGSTTSGNSSTTTFSEEVRAPEIMMPHAFLCPCFYEFRRQMQFGSQAPFLVTMTKDLDDPQKLARIPSIPPPAYS